MSTAASHDVITVRCPVCGAQNRVPLAKLAQNLRPICGRCKSPLPVADGVAGAVAEGPVVVTDATFAEQVERSPLPVLLDLWAPWCGPCGILAPTIDQLASELAGRVRVAKLNTDENPATAARFNVRSIPTLLVLRNGRELDRIVGVQSKAAIQERLSRAIG